MLKRYKFSLPFLFLCLIFFTTYIFNNYFTEYDVIKPVSELQSICSSLNTECVSGINLDFATLSKLNPTVIATIKHNRIIFYILQFIFLFLLFFTFTKTTKEFVPENKKINVKLLILFMLFSSYKIIYLYTNNILNIPIGIAFVTILPVLLQFLFFFFVFKFFTKNTNSSLILSTFTSFFLTFYQPIMLSKAYNEDIFKFIGTFLLCVTFILYINADKIIKFFTPFAITLLCLCVFNATGDIIKSLNFQTKTSFKNELNNINQTDRDIYIFILDMYAGFDTVKHHGYDNSDFIKQLKDRNFLVYENINSNYNKTSASMPSMFNFNYIDTFDFNTVSDSLNNAELFKFAKQNGYYIYYLNSWPVSHKLNNNLIDNFYSTNNVIYKSSLDLFYSQHVLHKPLTKMFNLLQNEPLQSVFTYTDNAINAKRRKLCIFHLLMPHWVYFYDENGEQLALTEQNDFELSDFHYKLNVESYLKFLKFTNKKTVYYIDKILENNVSSNKKAPIIIITGDHGTRDEYYNRNENLYFNNLCKNPWFLKDHFNTFLAYYNPNVDYDEYKDISSLVNFFRKFSNHTFNTSFESLPDKKYYIYMDSPMTYYDKINGFYLK